MPSTHDAADVAAAPASTGKATLKCQACTATDCVANSSAPVAGFSTWFEPERF